MTEHLLLFARDPGATNQILALLRLLADEIPAPLRETVAILSKDLPLPPQTPMVTTLAKDYACQRLPAENVPVTVWEELAHAPGPDSDPTAALRARLEADGITHIVTGVSDNDDKTHQKLWRAAHDAGITCVTLLDDDLNLAARFTDETGAFVWPDRIYAVSERSIAALRELGIPESAVEVIANLHMTLLAGQTSPQHVEEARTLRAAWSGDAVERVILFASQPIREMCAFGKPANFDEYACLEQLSRHLNRDTDTSVVVIRPHPRDVPGKYERFVGSGPPRMIVSNRGSSVGAILAVDAVAGMNSMLLNEAEALSRPVIHLTGEDMA